MQLSSPEGAATPWFVIEPGTNIYEIIITITIINTQHRLHDISEYLQQEHIYHFKQEHIYPSTGGFLSSPLTEVFMQKKYTEE